MSDKSQEGQAWIVGSAYKKNMGGMAIQQTHDMVVELREYHCVGHDEIELDREDFPYVKLALIDRHLDELLADESV
jgi:hypothetical protein